jgi:hypothetical protein
MSRAIYLLSLEGIEISEDKVESIDSEFLSYIMDRRIEIDETENRETLEALRFENQG